MDPEKAQAEPEISPLEWEERILNIFLVNWTDNPKKLKKLAKRIYPTAPEFIQKRFLTFLMQETDPAQYLRESFDYVTECMQHTKEFLAKGDHGMLFHNNVIYPINLKTWPHWLNRDTRWHPDDEREIQQIVVAKWMEEHPEVKYFQGKLVLFWEHGFGGRFVQFNDKEDPAITGGKVSMANLLYRKKATPGSF